MRGPPSLAIVVLAEDVRRDLAGLEIVAGALEADEIPAVHVDLDGGAVTEVVELMDLVRVGNEQRDLARLDQHRAVLFQGGVTLAVAVVDAPEARLLDGIAHDADHPPGAMIVRPHVRPRAP